MKLLDNSTQGILPLQKRLLYRTCVLPIALYGFQLWFFKGAPTVYNMTELKKMQRRTALWITGAFRTSPSEGIEAVAGLIPIYLHLWKLNGQHQLWYATIPPLHAINSLLDHAHAKNHPAHKLATSSFTSKQKAHLKSPIKDVNKHLNEIQACLEPNHVLFSPGSRVVDHFSSRIVFHSLSSSSDDDTIVHIQKLNQAFRMSQISPHSTTIIADGGVKKSNVALAVAHTWTDNHITRQAHVQAMNITPVEAELIAIRIGLMPALNDDNIHQILVVTNAISAANYILESRPNLLQKAVLPITSNLKSFFEKDNRNHIHFWQCPKKAKWPRHILVDDQVKVSANVPTLPSKNSYLFSRKKECDGALIEWQKAFSTEKRKGQLFLDFEDDKQRVIKPTYTKGGSWLPSIGFINALCVHFTRMTTGHTPIGEYRQRFFPNSPTSCPCSQADLQTCEHIIMQCPLAQGFKAMQHRHQ